MWIVEDIGHLKAEDEMKWHLNLILKLKERFGYLFILEQHAVSEIFQDFFHI